MRTIILDLNSCQYVKTVSFAHITRIGDIILDNCKGKAPCCGLIEVELEEA